MILIILLNFLYAVTFILAKFGLSMGTPIFSTACRIFLGGLLSLCVYHLIDPSWRQLSVMTQKTWIFVGILACINVYACNAFEIWGLQYLSVGKTAFIYNLAPFFTALLAYLAFQERMTYQKWLGLSLGFVGFLPILMEPASIIDTTMSFGFLSLAEIALLCAAASSVIGWTVMRMVLHSGKFSPFFLNGISMMAGGALCFAHAFLYESQPFINHGYFWNFTLIITMMAVIKYGIASNLNTHLLKKYTTTLIAFFAFTGSLFSAILGFLFFSEPISSYFMASVIIVFTGLLIFYQEELRQGYIKH